MTDLRAKLSELRKAVEAATPGPWIADHQEVVIYMKLCNHRMAFASTKENAAFIAAARKYMPLLIEVARAMEYIANSAVHSHSTDCEEADAYRELVGFAGKALSALESAK